MKPPMPLMLRADARRLPLADASVDLVVTSPPYFALRSYTDGGQHYAGQVGSEATPTEFLDALIECTREMARVLKPSGSIFVNLGDKYVADNRGSGVDRKRGKAKHAPCGPAGFVGRDLARQKSLMLLPERFRIRCVDELGLIARAVIVWSKPNGLPESVTDRVRRSHEDWVHLTKLPRYYSAVDEIREQASDYRRNGADRATPGGQRPRAMADSCNPLGKLPGSVWEIATQPLAVPAELGVDHFAAFPMEWPRRLITGWSPREVCTVCGEGRRPVAERRALTGWVRRTASTRGRDRDGIGSGNEKVGAFVPARTETQITGRTCACIDTAAPVTPGVVLDPFGGTGTTALVATMLGRRGISVDLSADYQRIAAWRCADPKERARAAGLDADAVAAIRPALPGQWDLFGEVSA